MSRVFHKTRVPFSRIFFPVHAPSSRSVAIELQLLNVHKGTVNEAWVKPGSENSRLGETVLLQECYFPISVRLGYDPAIAENFPSHFAGGFVDNAADERSTRVEVLPTNIKVYFCKWKRPLSVIAARPFNFYVVEIAAPLRASKNVSEE